MHDRIKTGVFTMPNMKIDEIRQYLAAHPQIFSSRNNCDVSTIVSSRKYFFIAPCGHEFDSLPANVFKDNKVLCPVCSGHRVVKGVNDLWTTHPNLAQYLLNAEDGYKYSFGSNKRVQWKCDKCGEIIEQTINKMSTRKSLCNNCGRIRSYAERFVSCVLKQLCELYEQEKIFDWSDKKAYDFYLPVHSCIIETHGKQHYSSDFSYLGGRTYEEEQMNDMYKYDLARKHGIREYIILKCDRSTRETLKDTIMGSLLPTLLMFGKKDIDWDECHEFATSNIVYEVCKEYDSNHFTIKDLAIKFGVCRNTVASYLKRGRELGWCSYDPQRSTQESHKKNGKRIVKTMSKPVIQMTLNGEYVNEFSSLQEAQRSLNISHIWDCIRGERNSAGGFKWKYK